MMAFLDATYKLSYVYVAGSGSSANGRLHAPIALQNPVGLPTSGTLPEYEAVFYFIMGDDAYQMVT